MTRSLLAPLLLVAGLAAVALSAQSSSGAESPDALVKQVFAALERQDSAALQQLSITEPEFKKFVWPTLGANVSGNNMTAEKFYKMYSASSGVGISEYLKQYGGKKIEVLKVTLPPPGKKTKGYRLLPGTQIVLRDDVGQEKTVNLLGGVLESDGHYKVATYYVRNQSLAGQR